MKTVSLEGLALVSNYTGAMGGWQVEVKRLLDILISGIALLIFLPFFLITAIAIKLTSSGPVFFVQERIGLNKRRFRVYKFRTMVPDAEKKQAELEFLNEVSGPIFKIKKDPRVTSVGRILRKLSIDEVPQLFNVLKGDMSLVGPRPLPIKDYNGFSEDWHRRRFSVRPGITCLWQVNGRSSLPFERWMEMDMEYIDKWSLWLDLKILAKTFPSVLRGSGAA
jgi:exopolysaccharide biosynthesis polyprenyl glycosylphosphotransferase